MSCLQVETQKDRSLRRRIQSLQIFLFEQLHRELLQAPNENSSTSATAAATSDEAAKRSGVQLASEQSGAADSSLTQTTSATLQPASPVDPPQTDAQSEAQDDKTVIDQTFGLMVRQRTKCLAQHKAEKHRQFQSFQVGGHL